MYKDFNISKLLRLGIDTLTISVVLLITSTVFQDSLLDNKFKLLYLLIFSLIIFVFSGTYAKPLGNVKEQLKDTLLAAFKLFLAYLIFSLVASMPNLKIPIIEMALASLLFFGISFCLKVFIKPFINEDPKNIIIFSNEINNIIKDLEASKLFNVKYIYQFKSSNDQNYLHSLEDLRDVLSHEVIHEYIILKNAEDDYQAIKNALISTGVPLSIEATITDKISGLVVSKSNYEQHAFNTYSLINVRLTTLFFKRVFDIVVALAGIVLTGIFSIILLPIIKKQSPGPLFFAQERVGQYGSRFKMYKFRSMYTDAEERKAELLKQNNIKSDLMFKMDNDPRIFPAGQKIRDWSIDELPQFINVLKGDMSVVGTRPPTVQEFEKYELHHFKRLMIKPGITGLWQVSGRSNITDFERVVQLDTEYIENFSIWNDFKILFKTFSVVLKKDGSQ